MAAEGKTPLLTNVFVEPCPLTHPRMSAVRSDNPARTDQVRPQPYAIRMEPGDDILPHQIDSSYSGPFDHAAVQLGSPYAEPVPDWEAGVHFHSRTEKADAAERIGIFRWD